jgi:hypothetical protein
MNAAPSALRDAIQACSGGSCSASVVLASGLQVHREHPQRPARQVQRNIGAAAQVRRRRTRQRQCRIVRINVVGQAAAHHQPDPLNHMVAGHVDRVAVGRKDACGDLAAVDLLDRDHVGVKLRGVAGQCGDVLGPLRVRIARQSTVAVRAIGEPFQVPGGDLQFRGVRRNDRAGQQQREQQPSHSSAPTGGAWTGGVWTGGAEVSGISISSSSRAPQSARNRAIVSKSSGSRVASAGSPRGTQITVS